MSAASLEAASEALQFRLQFGCVGLDGKDCWNDPNEGKDLCSECYEALSTCKECKSRMVQMCRSFYQCNNQRNCSLARRANASYDEWNTFESECRTKKARESYTSRKHEDLMDVSKVSKKCLEKKDYVCSICLEEFQENQSVSTLHCCDKKQYHSECIDEWLKNSTLCPICRHDIDENKKSQN